MNREKTMNRENTNEWREEEYEWIMKKTEYKWTKEREVRIQMNKGSRKEKLWWSAKRSIFNVFGILEAINT